tara:strand:+ start:150 stop:443 length:294 start_codon:yes stop_codon:yes gene_type:complete
MKKSTLKKLIFGVELADWMKKGSCRGLQTDIFYHEQGHLNINTAKAICSGCSIREQCLDYAMRNQELYGIWGGYTTSERSVLRKEWEEKAKKDLSKT